MDFKLYIIAALLFVLIVIWLRWRWVKRRPIRQGRKGEHKVARELGRLPKRDYILINDVLIHASQGRTTQIDHILISTKGIFVIETKSHKGRITGSEFGQYWQQRLILQSRSFYNPLLQNESHIKHLRKFLPGFEESLFISVVVFTDAWQLDITADDIVEHRTLIRDKRTMRTLDPERSRESHWWSWRSPVVLDESKIVTRLPNLRKEIKRRQPVLDREEIDMLALRIRELDDRSRKAHRQHTRYARTVAKNINREINQGICPRCGGTLVIRKGKSGQFIGCSNYPDCRFSAPLA